MNERLTQILAPFFDLNLRKWKGLPHLKVEQFQAAFGTPISISEEEVGCFPARCSHFMFDSDCKFKVYDRQGEVIMLCIMQPKITKDIYSDLGEPDEILRPELFRDEGYAHEELYCKNGILITRLQYRDKTRDDAIIRLRTFQPIDSVSELNSELYFPWESREKWS